MKTIRRHRRAAEGGRLRAYALGPAGRVRRGVEYVGVGRCGSED